MINYMVTIVPNMSWERLAAYLYFTENQAALTEVKNYFQKQLGMWIETHKMFADTMDQRATVHFLLVVSTLH